MNTLRTLTKALMVLVSGSIAVWTSAQAQHIADVRGMALGAASVASARSVEALLANPANLAIDSSVQSWSLAFALPLPTFGVMAGTSVLTREQLGTYFSRNAAGERYRLSDNERDAVFAALQRGSTYVQTGAMPFALALRTPIGVVGLSAVVNSGGVVRLPQGLERLAQGYDGTTPFALENASANAILYGAVQASYAAVVVDNLRGVLRDVPTAATPLPVQPSVSNDTTEQSQAQTQELPPTTLAEKPTERSREPSPPAKEQSFAQEPEDSSALVRLSVGATMKYIAGLAYEELHSTSRIGVTPFLPSGFQATPSWAVQAQYGTRSAGTGLLTDLAAQPLAQIFGAGAGFGADIGATALLRVFGAAKPNLVVAVSLVELGVVTWENARALNVNAQDTLHGLLNVLADRGYFARFRDQVPNRRTTFSTMLPLQARVGAMLDAQATWGMGIPMNIMLEYTQGFNTIGANTLLPRVGLGVELPNTGWLPSLRTGVQVGGIAGVQWSAGLGWREGAFSLDVATGSLNSLLGAGTTAWLGLRTSWDF
jgi:hypothetical protein